LATSTGQLAIAISSCPALNAAHNGFVDSESKAHERFIRFLRTSQRILVFTGAGVSTGSGIPDFRGPQGVWRRRRPVYYNDFMSSEEARIEHWDYKLEAWPAFLNATPMPFMKVLSISNAPANF
jgi:NAD-dependent SIR2 family protein deacetylase